MKDYKKEEVYVDLQEKIIKHDIPSGTKLNEKELMAEYEIGRTPFRSVITRLASEHLVEVIPQSGTYVKKSNLDELKDNFTIRIPLELLAVKLIAMNITPNQLEEIKFNLSSLLENENTLSIIEIKNKTLKIINLYYEAAGNKRLTNLLISLHNFCLRAWYSMPDAKVITKKSMQEWSSIINMIENKEIEKAQKIVKKRIEEFASSLGIECVQI